MKTIKIFTFLVLFSLQAGATGYAHNMFVAHKKLQAGKEYTQPSEKIIAKKAKPSKVVKHRVEALKPVASIESQFTRNSENKTLNERILEAGPSSFFTITENNEGGDSVVTRLVAFVRCTIYAFIGLPS